jgi:hypothetical protein
MELQHAVDRSATMNGIDVRVIDKHERMMMEGWIDDARWQSNSITTVTTHTV